MIALLLLWGCKDPCPPGDVPELEIGTGERDFVAVPVGGDVDESFGGQGGFHYWVALRGTQLEPKDARVTLEVFFDEELIYDATYIDQDFKCNRDEAVTELTELRIQPERAYDSADTGLGRYYTGDLEIKAIVTEATGRVVEATTTWTVDP